MDQRIVEFIAGLRVAGVRVSVAESIDALRAVEQVGMVERDLFRAGLQAALIKESHDQPVFQELFPRYFGFEELPPMQQPGGGSMNEQEQQMFQQMLQHLLEHLSPEQLARLFEAMMSGQRLSREQMNQMLSQAMSFLYQLLPMPHPSPQAQAWMVQYALQTVPFDRLVQALDQMLAQLRAAGLSETALRDIEQTAHENMAALAEQLGQEIERMMREQMRQQTGTPRPSLRDLMDRPFENLSRREMEELRQVVTRLAARLRSRAALRQRRSKAGPFDARRTIRSNLRFGGIPLILRHRRRYLKPKITILCDLSYSMRPVASFTLLLIYALQDQVSRTRSFAFIDDLTDISTDFAEMRPEQALEAIQQRVRPPGSYSTDLGHSLRTFVRDYFSCVDSRTTVIFLGDGRNNYHDPNLQAFDQVCRRARRVIWFNPEAPHMWGVEYPDTLNSDMLEYAHRCDAVHQVSNLRQLITAIDTLFVRG
ncbi:MAG: VWA domain-containing protein [Chloroflexaceae bacterium]|nr:VWA domain-containing protein [Chloroflexaceae bacterium]